MAYSMKRGGKEVGPASVNAPPHTKDGKAMKISSNPGKESEDCSIHIAVLDV
jgi:hypothetical protein